MLTGKLIRKIRKLWMPLGVGRFVIASPNPSPKSTAGIEIKTYRKVVAAIANADLVEVESSPIQAI